MVPRIVVLQHRGVEKKRELLGRCTLSPRCDRDPLLTLTIVMRLGRECCSDGTPKKNRESVRWKAHAANGPWPECPFCTDDSYASGKGGCCSEVELSGLKKTMIDTPAASHLAFLSSSWSPAPVVRALGATEHQDRYFRD